GNYGLMYIPTVAGADYINITLKGDVISGNPYASVVQPGDASASASTASISDAKAGETTTITITVRDKEGNVIIDAVPDAFAISVAGTNAGATVSTIVANGDGTYTATYVPGSAGTDVIHIAFNDAPIHGSPYTSVVAISSVVADAPDGLIAAAGDKAVSFSWTAPANTGGAAITDYVVQYSNDNGETWHTYDDGVSSQTQATITGLTNNRP